MVKFNELQPLSVDDLKPNDKIVIRVIVDDTKINGQKYYAYFNGKQKIKQNSIIEELPTDQIMTVQNIDSIHNTLTTSENIKIDLNTYGKNLYKLKNTTIAGKRKHKSKRKSMKKKNNKMRKSKRNK